MSRADDDLLCEVQIAMVYAMAAADGTLTTEVLARAAISAVRSFDAAKVVPLFPRKLTIGWDDAAKAVKHSPEGPK